MQLKGKVAIVTGGAGGIGRAIANLLQQQGATVVICGRGQAQLTEAVQQIQQEGGKALAVVTDVRDAAQVNHLVQRVLAELGRIDILINNAGVAIAKPVADFSETEWDAMIDTNLKGAFLLSQAALAALVTTQGVIVNVSSTLGLIGLANFVPYCASKYGLIGLTAALADELQSQVRVYAVCPGRTATEMQRQLGGEAIALLAMPPDKVATKISGLITGEISLASGKALVIDHQSWQMTGYEIGQQLKGLARKLLVPLKPIIKSLRQK